MKRVDGTFTVDEVIDAYHRGIGLNLRIDERVPGQYVVLTTLPGPPFAPIAPDLGLFSVYVAGGEAQAEALIGSAGVAEEQANPQEPGVRFVADTALVERQGALRERRAGLERRRPDPDRRALPAPGGAAGVPGRREAEPAGDERCVKDQTGRRSRRAGIRPAAWDRR